MRDVNLQWYFQEGKWGGAIGPNDGMSDLFSRDDFQNLIRESIQNSLDAKRPDAQCVRVEYRIRKLEIGQYPHLMEIKNHIQGCAEKYPKFPKYTNMLQYANQDEMLILDVADYNTIGMDFNEKDDSGRFSKFVRTSGDPNSDSGAGGSHGYGKITYFNVSSIRTILVSSMYYENNTCVFEGVARLATHPLNGEPKPAYAATGFYDDADGDPIQETPEFIGGKYVYKRIPKDFQRQESGTTVSILFAHITEDTIGKTFEDCCKAVLRSFFVALESNMLEVVIDLGHGYEIEINKNTISEIFRNRFFTSVEDTAKNKIFERLNPHPYWLAYKNNTEVTIPQGMSSEDAAMLCIGKQYVLIEDKLPILGSVSFYSYLHPTGNDVVVFMRCPKMMVNVTRPNKQTKRGFSSVFICNDKTGNELLRQMENAAHNQWTFDQLRKDCRAEADVLQAQEIENEMKQFINKCLNEILFPKSASDSESVELDEFTVPMLEESENTNSFIGPLISIQGQDTNQTGAPVQLLVGAQESSAKRKSFGQAQTIEKKKVKKTEKKTDLTSGHSKKHKSEGSGTSTSGPDNYEEDKSEEMEVFVRQKINVGYRVISQKDVEGKDGYLLIVHSPIATEKAHIILTPIGETADKENGINIAQSSQGKVKGNEISDVTLVEGKNCINFRLNEEGEYTFTLKAEHEVLVK